MALTKERGLQESVTRVVKTTTARLLGTAKRRHVSAVQDGTRMHKKETAHSAHKAIRVAVPARVA